MLASLAGKFKNKLYSIMAGGILKVVFIGDKDTVTAFRLIGIEGIVVNSPSEMESRLSEVIRERKDVGLILLSDYYATDLMERINELRLKFAIPAITIVPSRRSRGEFKVDYKEVIKSALGLKV
ncbi:MAG: V-type ATP synthase subunit F [Thermoprotei archaeon]|nr:MAG: V-type ATP synthase subunit F [Thermoprotei archaeon]